MTNQQAINLLKDLEQCLDDYCELNDEGKAAFRMAITALEVFGNSEQLTSAQPDVPDICVGDMISRQAAIDAIGEKPFAGTGDEYDYEQGLQNQWERDVVAIKILPPAQPKQVCVANVTLTDEQVKELVEKAKNAVTSVIKPEQRWIPCSERLPEDEYVLISKKPTKISGSKWSVTIAIRTADPRSRKIQWRDIGFGVIQDDNVLAWMPLPEPYREEGEKR